MDICISHLYNRQIKKNILQDVFYKLENYDNEEFLCFDVNSSGSLLVAASKTSLYFFHILTGTLLIQHSYYNENERENSLKRDIFEDIKICASTSTGVNDKGSNSSTRNEGIKSVEADDGNEFDNDKEIENENCTSGNISRSDNISSNDFSNMNDNINNNEIDNMILCCDVRDSKCNTISNYDEDLKTTKEEESCCTPNLEHQNGNEFSENSLAKCCSKYKEDSVKSSNKRKHILLKGQKSKKVKKRSRQSQKNLNRGSENVTNSKIKNNENSTKKSTDDKFEDENLHIKKIQFIKNDKYLLCISKRYLHIFKIFKYPITRIVYIDLLYLCIGIETIISNKLFFPCFFSEYFYFFLKENEYNKQRVEESLMSGSLSNDFSGAFGSSYDLSINKCEEISECSKNFNELESPQLICNQNEVTSKGHLNLFKDYYKLFSSLNFQKSRDFEMCEVMCMDLKKKKYMNGNEKRNLYIINLVLCLKEQIPYVSRVYVEEMNDPNGAYMIEPDEECMNDYVVDVNETFPIISYSQMDITFQETARESSLHVRKDALYPKHKAKIKKKYLKGVLKNLVYNQESAVNKKECTRAFGESTVEVVPKEDIIREISESAFSNGKMLENEEGYTSSSNHPVSETQREPVSACDEKNNEYMQLTKFFENYENNRKYLKKLTNGYFPICVFKKRSKRRSKELPTALNIYDNLDALLKGHIEGSNNLNRDIKEKGIFKKENNYYIFDYSEKEKTNYFNFPCNLLKNKSSLKNVYKNRHIDKNKYNIFVGTPCYILAFEMSYVKKRILIEEDVSRKMDVLKKKNFVNTKIKNISVEILRTCDNYLKKIEEENIAEKKIQLKFLFKIHLGMTIPLDIVIREKGNILCVRTLEKVFLYKINYKYSAHCIDGIENSESMQLMDEKNSIYECENGTTFGDGKNNVNDGVINESSINKCIKSDELQSYIDRICLYHTIHNPIQKEVHELCSFSEDIYQSYLLVVSLKSGQYTLYIYDLKHMDLQNAVKVNISAYKGFKQMRWIKCYDMLVALSNMGNYILVLKNKHLNNWSFFISDFELIDSNIEVIEEENEFDIIENIQPKHKNIDDNIWKYIIFYINLFIKNKISIQNLIHPSSLFPIIYTGYYKNSPIYFFYKSYYDFSKENFLSYEANECIEDEQQIWGDDHSKQEKKKKKKKKNHSLLQIRENLDHYVHSKFEESEEDEKNDILITDNSNCVQLLAHDVIYYVYYKNIVNFSL
ncbi:hypothetical protein, conserved [Plasmodium gonderi]|uniref:Uncharacterized protein n=1 Tax=Plasmodium gonderi TaxID=77519 RepID=A0A1Y1J8N7_PLAGO|nr:hypothetical protein, conserved [Plasmodium gonderi]GAW78871.1 hypothetical protein, conserved [Plasmodium gonderi]